MVDQDGGLRSSLRTPLMSDLNPEFSTDGGLTWKKTHVDACEVAEDLTVNFERVAPQMPQDPAAASAIMKKI